MIVWACPVYMTNTPDFRLLLAFLKKFEWKTVRMSQFEPDKQPEIMCNNVCLNQKVNN